MVAASTTSQWRGERGGGASGSSVLRGSNRARSEEGRGGEKGRTRGGPDHLKKKKKMEGDSAYSEDVGSTDSKCWIASSELTSSRRLAGWCHVVRLIRRRSMAESVRCRRGRSD